jgi:hypothetical protein
MNFLFLILPKIINHKRLELFEFRQVQHLLEMTFYYPFDFESKKVQEKLGLVLVFGDAMAKSGQTLSTSSFLQLSKFRNFTNSKTKYLKGDPLNFTEKAPIICELCISSF